MGEILATWLIETFALTAAEAAVASFAIQMVASSIVSSTFASDPPNSGLSNQSSLNTGVNLQVAPATNNKLPVVYGNSFIGGTITDLSITTDNQDLYYVMSLCEVTGGSSPDTITFGDIYFGGKLCVFDGTDQTKVVGLTDQSTGTTDSTVSGHLYIYLYNNGSNSPVNSSQSAISVMQSSGLTYTWDSTKLMSNCAFAIVHLNYNQNANITNIQQTQFEIINPRNSAGDVLYDYLTNTRYGAAIPATQIDTTSITALNTYCNQVITYTPYSGGSATQARFKMNGFVDTTKTIMKNLQDITNSCDCLLQYNEIYGVWSVIVQSPTYTVAMDINDSNMISSINISSKRIISNARRIDRSKRNYRNNISTHRASTQGYRRRTICVFRSVIQQTISKHPTIARDILCATGKTKNCLTTRCRECGHCVIERIWGGKAHHATINVNSQSSHRRGLCICTASKSKQLCKRSHHLTLRVITNGNLTRAYCRCSCLD